MLVYKLTNIQLEYETIHNDVLAKEATNVYCSAKAFPYDHIMREEATLVVIAKNRFRQRSRLSSFFLFFSFHLFIVFSSPFVCCKLVLGILM